MLPASKAEGRISRKDKINGQRLAASAGRPAALSTAIVFEKTESEQPSVKTEQTELALSGPCVTVGQQKTRRTRQFGVFFRGTRQFFAANCTSLVCVTWAGSQYQRSRIESRGEKRMRSSAIRSPWSVVGAVVRRRINLAEEQKRVLAKGMIGKMSVTSWHRPAPRLHSYREKTSTSEASSKWQREETASITMSNFLNMHVSSS